MECNLNVQINQEFDGWLDVECEPNLNDKLSQYLFLRIETAKGIKCGPVASRSKNNVYGLFWTVGEKKCKLFFALQNKAVYDSYSVYLEEVLNSLETSILGEHPFSLQLLSICF